VPTDKGNELKVSWTARAVWRYAIMEYTILYHARNEMENKVCWYCIVKLYSTAIIIVLVD